jgi:XTP/dITP diphosphohydrolase
MANKVDKILVATGNPGKIKELQVMLGNEVEWMGLSDFPCVAEVKEDGNTFAENAQKKALGYAKATGLLTIADDSGLVVDALDGAPGVHSARFSGDKPKEEDITLIDRRNIAKVLELLKAVPTNERTARFICSICLASPEKILAETEGKLEGLIAESEIGTSGFGYDPIFYIPQLNKTVAQLTPEKKNEISHRGKAIRKLKLILKELREQ